MNALLQEAIEERERTLCYNLYKVKGDDKDFLACIEPYGNGYQVYVDPGEGKSYFKRFASYDLAKAWADQNLKYTSIEPTRAELSAVLKKLAKKRAIVSRLTEWDIIRLEKLVDTIQEKLRETYSLGVCVEFLKSTANGHHTIDQALDEHKRNCAGQYWNHVRDYPFKEIDKEVKDIVRAIRAGVRKQSKES